MKIRLFTLIAFSCLLMFRCAHAPDLNQIGEDPQARKACLSVYPTKPIRAVHRIEAGLPFGGYSAFVGVIEVHPGTGAVKVVLLSPEGMTILDAESSGDGIRVNSALPGIDAKEYAARMIDDIRFLFIPPEGDPCGAGALSSGSFSCCWMKGGMRTRVACGQGTASVSEIRGTGKIVRQAGFESPAAEGLYSRMMLDVGGLTGYRLRFELLESEDSR